MLLLQSCPAFCDLMDQSLQGSSVSGILQKGILEQVSQALLQGIFPTQGLNPCLIMSPALAGGFFTTSATDIIS